MANSPRGQSLAEYSIGVAVVVAALVAMSIYAKRSIQGRYADAVKGATVQFTTNNTQYEPYYVNSTVVTKVNVSDTEDTALDTSVTRALSESYNSTIYKKDGAKIPSDE